MVKKISFQGFIIVLNTIDLLLSQPKRPREEQGCKIKRL